MILIKTSRLAKFCIEFSTILLQNRGKIGKERKKGG